MPQSVFKALGNKSLVEQIVDNFINAIIAGKFKPGDKIPSENELCESMQVGRNSLREAIKILVAYGVLRIRRGDGTYIEDSFNDKMLYPVIYGIILQKDSFRNVLELRKIIDSGILQLAIERVNPRMLAMLDEGLARLAEVASAPASTAEDIFYADIAFHDVFVNITGNNMLISIYHYMDRITTASRIATTEQLIAGGDIADVIRKHEELIALVRDKNRLGISAVVESHYQFWEQNFTAGE